MVKYSVLGHKYDRGAQIYVTQQALHLREDIWETIPPEKQAELLKAKVWTKKGMAEFQRQHRIAWNNKKSASSSSRRKKMR